MADELGSRFAGTESEKKAQIYLVKKFKEYGFSHALIEEFTYYGWKRGSVSLTMLKPIKKELNAIALALSPGGEVEGNVIDIGTGSPEEFAKNGRNVKGRIALCSSATSPTGKRVHRRTKYGYAVDYGAIGFIFMNHNPGQLPPTGSLRPAYRMGGEIPGIGISMETGSQMLRLAKSKQFKVRFKDESRLIPNSISANVVAELPGKTEEWLVVGGHYDGHDIAQGAMDNLSAIAVIMEVARVLEKYRGTFRRSIRFIAFGCEEIGVTGSTCYVDQHQNELKKITIMVNLELGRLAQKDGTQHVAFRFCQQPQLEKMLKKFSEEIKYPMIITKETSTASDHWPFYMRGVPAINMREEPSPQLQTLGRGWGHTSADTMDKVDARNLHEGAMVLGRLLIRLASWNGKIAEHISIEEIVKTLEDTELKKHLEIQKMWHPYSVR
ncbi:MAG: M28 family peptidase [Candidatus Bathyarchaeota archaeon]|nr:MAG: M28 family peptidase [Candidatus Bathyarchaeota archaeon]